MNTEWLVAFVAAPGAVVVLAALYVFFTRPDASHRHRIRPIAKSE